MKKIKKAFTLVELIVVITILAILATIGFVSYQGYTRSARESARINDIRVIEKSLSLYSTKNNVVPLPDNAITITASGTTVGYQGEAGTGVLKTISQPELIQDPLDDEFYSYFVSANQTSLQMLALMENSESVVLLDTNNTYAAPDYSERYPKLFGRALGMITYTDNTPLHQSGSLTSIDVVSYSGSVDFTSHFTKDRSVTGTGRVLRELIQNANCNRIKELTNTNNGIYTVNPRGAGEFQVYCEMGIDDGGWMLVARTHPSSIGNTDFGWLETTGSLDNNETAYSLGSNIANIDFDQIMLTAYITEKEVAAAVRLDIDRDFFQSEIVSPDVELDGQYSTTSNCTEVFDSTIPLFDAECDTTGYRYWGAFGANDRYVFNRQNTSESGLIYGHQIDTGNNGLPKDLDMPSSGGDPSFDNLRKENGMIFVR